MDTGNELSRIGDTISNFLIDDDYKIDDDDTLEWSELIQVYIMRYRRIIGIVILVILLGIMYFCSWKDDSEKEFGLQIGGGNHEAAVGAEMAKLRATDEAQTAFAKEKGDKATADAKAAEQKGKAEQAAKLVDAKAAKKTAKKARRGTFKDTYTTEQVTKLKSAAGDALGKSKLGQFATGKMGDIKNMRSAGMSKFGVAKELTGQAGQFASDKFKEFAGWLYEILFALAISIAICMIVVPSIAFFALGLICYFLLRKKISSMKAF